MLGGIYSDQRCPTCQAMFQDNHRDGLVCPKHPHHRATRFKAKFKGIYRRFRSYQEAQRWLTGLRFKMDEGSFDSRDYRPQNPLGFENLARKWLKVKEKVVERKSYNNLRNYIEKAVATWGQKNIKEIDYGELEDFIFGDALNGLSDKTRSNIRSCLHDFWMWLRKRRIITLAQIPEFPEVKYELGWRSTIDKTTQEEILDEVYRISWHINPKIFIGIRFLCTYIAIRPFELIQIKEEDLNLEVGYVRVRRTKDKRPKTPPLLEEDVELIKSLPRGLPHVPYFRHVKGLKGIKAGQPFGPRYLYKWWKRACDNLGIRGVDLYGGTRHSSVSALGEEFSPEEIKNATMHSTNRAFERYFLPEAKHIRPVYERTRAKKKEGKVIKFEKPSQGD